MPSYTDSLHLIVEASLALAGFAGVVTALAQGGVAGLTRLRRLSLVNLLATSLAALFLSLIALVLIAASVAEAATWRLISSAGLVTTLYFALLSTRTVLAASSDEGGIRSTAVLWYINVPLLGVCAAQVWNIVALEAFWPVLLLLVALFAIGCFSFVRLLLNPSS